MALVRALKLGALLTPLMVVSLYIVCENLKLFHAATMYCASQQPQWPQSQRPQLHPRPQPQFKNHARELKVIINALISLQVIAHSFGDASTLHKSSYLLKMTLLLFMNISLIFFIHFFCSGIWSHQAMLNLLLRNTFFY